MRQLTPTQVVEQLAQEGQQPLLLDVREAWEYDICAIDGAVLIPMAEVPSRLHEFDKNKTTIVICHHGVRSWHIARLLDNAGFTDVINLAGGIDAWAQTVDLSMNTY